MGEKVEEGNGLSSLQLLGALPFDPGGKGETGKTKAQVGVSLDLSLGGCVIVA